MANNFRLTGDYYVSKEGSDSNDGLTPETPLLTVQTALNKVTTGVTRRIIIGSGIYKESLSKSLSAGATMYVISDGYVVFEGIGTDEVLLNPGSSGANNYYFIGIEFRNYSQINFAGTPVTVNSFYFIKCIIKNNLLHSVNNGNYSLYFDSTIFINSTFKFAIASISRLFILSYDKCIFINSSQEAWELFTGGINQYNHTTAFKNSYIDSNSLIRIKGDANPTTGVLSGNSTTVGNVINNNIQGKVVFPWTGAVSGINTWNVSISYAQAKIDYPTYFFNSMSADPKFNDPQRLNFTLQSSSPHIKAASDYTNIGSTEYAVYKSATSTEFTSGATISGLTLRGNNSYTITSSPTPGTLETAPISIQWPAIKPLTKLEWSGVLEFNKSITAGTFGNNNVPDWDTYTTGAGASPDRLTVKMRFSTQQTQPTLSSHWDNGGYWTAGNYELFEVNQKPKVDSNGKGNGNPDYIETTGLGDIVPTWIQLNIKLIDTYNP